MVLPRINKFEDKKKLYSYIINKFRNSMVILVHGSTANKKIRNYSDFDVEIYGKNIKKPYYEILFIKEAPVLLSVYFYKYKSGKKTIPKKGIKVIKGDFSNNLDGGITPIYGEGKYTSKERLKRDCQLVTDFMFKYFRSKDKTYLKYVQKRIK
ncbi:MAG: hypothetical protein ABIH25_04120 [Candidatus Woesearchaeota archaeon]